MKREERNEMVLDGHSYVPNLAAVAIAARRDMVCSTQIH